MPTDNVLVSTRGLCKRFKTRVANGKGWQKKTVNAVADVSLDIVAGETLALVGESGCGKTTLGRMLSLFYQPSEGDLAIKGEDVAGLKPKQVKPLRRHVQMIFQDPVSSLNPRHTVEAILTEPLKFFSSDNAQQRREKAVELLEAVGLPERSLRKYPHEFSGGQRQRIVIARALILHPAFVVADEPVSALDVSVQSQILNLLKDLREQFNLTYLFISHDLAVVHHLADRVAVMYLGRIVEVGERDSLFQNPRHPYTQALLSSVPGVVPNKGKIGKILHGDPPSPISPPHGCPFHPRCPLAQDRCRQSMPVLEAADSNGAHQVACHFQEQAAGPAVIKEVVQL
ncbi:dipeptide ABC transporter ATP-binding protein [Porticoccus sp. W117]|uniref:ABC transporter ATP-binding protein n=1 Tax=Porticoccus sp. W117 TaxID=3054777 RepID=UPI00259AC0AA|nr:dipeptide ABC transporter ATP-binding protein [Porticoccus sp. W117]MDM3871039.1 dipeptide ABC transporter ATP-binding protein [Porticoccus sp. W117]